MIGNQSDWFLIPKRTVWGPQQGEYHVIRGASWMRGYKGQLRWAYRDYGVKGSADVGFRIGKTLAVPEYAQ